MTVRIFARKIPTLPFWWQSIFPQSKYPGLYIIGDGSGVTHPLSHASASGVHVARHIAEELKKVDVFGGGRKEESHITAKNKAV